MQKIKDAKRLLGLVIKYGVIVIAIFKGLTVIYEEIEKINLDTLDK
jgi:hypothetical protein